MINETKFQVPKLIIRRKISVMKYFFGVDGGGTGCRVALVSETARVLAKAEGGPANIETSFITARKNILDTCLKALKSAEISKNEIANSCAVLGLAGSNLGNYAAELAKNLPFSKNIILNDGEITLEGAIGPSDGCIGALGTGSIFVGRKNGKTKLIGGWGFNLGDDGSGSKLGKELMRLSIRCHDGLEKHSDVTLDLLRKFDNDIKLMVEKTKSFQPKDYALYAPQVFEALQNNDHNARNIIDSESKIIEKALIATGFSSKKPFCLIGGLGSLFLPHLSKVFRESAIPPKGDALEGAIAIALREFQ